MVERISRAQAIYRLKPTWSEMDEECDGGPWQAEDFEDFNSLSNGELARRLNEEDGFDEDDEDRYEVYGEDDYVEPTLANTEE